MFKTIFIAASLIATASAGAERVDFPSYGAVKGLDRYADQDTYRRAVEDPRYVMERVAYPSDGLTVYAYVYRPANPHGRLPVVVFNRGSHTWPAFAAEMLPMAHRMALEGYIVVAPMYRGSGGALGWDELGGADLNDLFNLLPVIKTMPFADPANLFLYGESRGGMMTYQALRDGFPAKAAAIYGGFTDLDAMLQTEQGARMGAVIWPELADNRAAIVTRRSAIQWPEKINAPVLIMHGGADQTVDPAQSLAIAVALQKLRKTYELKIFAGEGHVLRGRAVERDAHAADWFTRFRKSD